MHCHNEFHAESGMALVFSVGDDSDLPPRPAEWPQCGNDEFIIKHTIPFRKEYSK